MTRSGAGPQQSSSMGVPKGRTARGRPASF
jgi:hypothetical protein